MKVAWILLITLFLVFLLEDSEAWRRRRFRVRVRGRRLIRKIVPRIRGRRLLRKIGHVVSSGFKTLTKVVIMKNPLLLVPYKAYKKYKARKEQGGDDGEACEGGEVCGGSLVGRKPDWHCDNICNVMANDQFTWPGEVVDLPCNFAEYDYDGDGYFSPADLGYFLRKRGYERDNMMVFRKIDTNRDRMVSETEFKAAKDLLLLDQETCG